MALQWNALSKAASAVGAGMRKVQPRKIITWDKAERIQRNLEIWKDPDSVVHRFPQHYQQRYWEQLLRDREPVHYRLPEARYEWDKKKLIRYEREVYPILPIYPPEADQGLWGGEGVVKGFFVLPPPKRKPKKPIKLPAQLWYPELKRVTVYSEVLNRYMSVIVTERALRKIDDHFGLDFYLLETPECDLCSKLACKLKREILISLANDCDFWPDNPEKKSDLKQKYEKFLYKTVGGGQVRMSAEECEWIGLDLNEAAQKQQDLEEAAERKAELDSRNAAKYKMEKQLENQLRHKDHTYKTKRHR